MKLIDVAKMLGAELSGPGDVDIRGVAGIADARENDITYLSDAKHLKDLAGCRASAVIIPANLAVSAPMPSLAVKNPRYAFALALRLFHEKPYAAGGISEQAVIGAGATMGADVTVHPFAVVADGARVGSRVTLYPGVYVGAGAVIGDDCILYPSVSVREGVTIGNRVVIHSCAVIGSDGFGFVTEGGKHHKIPQVGGVIIEDDVEIGANSTIDRATLGNTVIKKGTKLDNMVHIAHNVTVGEHCLLAAQVGIAGSSSLGKYVVIGGQAGVGDHLAVGDGVMVGGGTAVTRDVEAGQVIAGHNAMPLRDWLKVQAVLPRLPELKKIVSQLERRIEELEKRQ
jgi:UDP-3-O-[3-hydroxymyristoyl] glucosamine N-acyltransferase